MVMKKLKSVVLIVCCLTFQARAQDDLESLVGDIQQEEATEYAKAGWKTTRVINSQSFENVAGGVLDLKFSHRFGLISGGAYELWGLDQAYIRIGADYGITDRLMVGFGRSSFEKTYDGFFKYKILRQSKGKVKMPVTMSLFSSIACKTLKQTNPDKTDYFSSRLTYSYQLIIGRKFSQAFSLQLMPSFIHRNWVETMEEKNDVLAFGIAVRQKVSKRMAITGEYYYVLPNQIAPDYYNSLSLGIDIETGGHVFQLHLSNSTSMIEKGFITETTGDWLKGDIHLGFNISRVFTITNKGRKV
jgi:hypothetical protein